MRKGQTKSGVRDDDSISLLRKSPRLSEEVRKPVIVKEADRSQWQEAGYEVIDHLGSWYLMGKR